MICPLLGIWISTVMVCAQDQDVSFKGSKRLITHEVKDCPPLKRLCLEEKAGIFEEKEGPSLPVAMVLSCPELVVSIQDQLSYHDLLVSGMVASLFKECFHFVVGRRIREKGCFNWLHYNFNPYLEDFSLAYLSQRRRDHLTYYFDQGVVEKAVSYFQDFLQEQYHIFHHRDYYSFAKQLHELQITLPTSLCGMLIILENMCWSSMVRQDMVAPESQDLLTSSPTRKKDLVRAQNQLQDLMVKISLLHKDISFKDDPRRQPLLNLYHFYMAFAKIHGNYPSPLAQMEMAYILRPLEERKNKAFSYFYMGKVFVNGEGEHKEFDLAQRLCLMALVEALNCHNKIFWRGEDASMQFYHLTHVVSFYLHNHLNMGNISPTFQVILERFLTYMNGYAEDFIRSMGNKKIDDGTFGEITKMLLPLFQVVLAHMDVYSTTHQKVHLFFDYFKNEKESSV